MTVAEALTRTIDQLQNAGIPDARLDAEYLVAEAVQLPRLQLTLHQRHFLTPEGQQQLARWTRERLERRPLAYVLGEQPFMNLHLRVDPAVLIPRPETELLVEEAYAILDNIPSASVADVGTGSGNIALSLTAHRHVKELHAVDISSAALNIAQENAMRNAIKLPIQWYQGDLLIPLIKKGLQVDLITANLPYVRTGELPTLSPEVRWEPALALDGGRDGLAYIYQLLQQAEDVLKVNGHILLEIGSDQDHTLLSHLRLHALWKKASMRRDLAGLPRIVHIQKGGLVGSLNH
jgi:release factor glutamine methyltransferase